MSDESPINLVKSRDDPEPVRLRRVSGEGEPVELQLTDGSTCSWAKSEDRLSTKALRARVEPWLTALFQSEHLSLLAGSGLTQGVHWMAAGKPGPSLAKADFGSFSGIVDAAATKSAQKAGREAGNTEDQLRVAGELLRGLQVQAEDDESARTRAASLESRIVTVLGAFATSILDGERGLRDASDPERQRAFNYLVSFLMSFSSRTGTRDRLHIFTTNYDRVIEAGAEVAGMHLLDRFVGTIAPLFRSSRLDIDLHYNPPGIRGEPRYVEGVARFTKLHGSLDWVDRHGAIRRVNVPFGAESPGPYLRIGETFGQLMIYPNAAKDRESAAYPFVDLFRDLAAAICRPNHTLVTYGYSFGDEHINRVVEDMLTIPSTHLVVLAYDDPLDRIRKTYERVGRKPQVTLLVGNELAGLAPLVDHYLPKASIDRTTFRMAELLKARWTVEQAESSEARPEPPDQA